MVLIQRKWGRWVWPGEVDEQRPQPAFWGRAATEAMRLILWGGCTLATAIVGVLSDGRRALGMLGPSEWFAETWRHLFIEE
jgi:hypothetical protein